MNFIILLSNGSSESFERTYLVVKRSSENSISNEGTSCLRGCEEETTSSGIFERRKDGETSTLGRNLKESFPTNNMKFS